MSLESRINAVADSIRLLAKRLAERGFEFDRPSEVCPGPEDGTADAIARIEREVGAVPLALRLFWQQVGSVNFCGTHPEWHGSEYPDPLFVYPPSAAIAELDEFLAHTHKEQSEFPYLVPIAPDSHHKENVSGGMWYNVSVPSVADDPPLNDEPHLTTFVAYLELAVQWAGFPGLSDGPGDWPIAELTRGIHADGS